MPSNGGGGSSEDAAARPASDPPEARREALDRLFEQLYERLRRISHRLLSAHRRSETLATTALVHETYLKLSRSRAWDARERDHFLSIAARAMRQIVVDAARERAADKRGDGAAHVAIDSLELGFAGDAFGLVALDEAMARLAAADPELERLVELRFFGGLSLEEIRAVTGIPERTLKRRFRAARALLAVDFDGAAEAPPAP